MLSSSANPKEAYEEFKKVKNAAVNEAETKGSVIPTLLKIIGAANDSAREISFTNITPATSMPVNPLYFDAYLVALFGHAC